MPDRIYENTIWTNHALERLSDRRLSQHLVWKAFQYPDQKVPATDHAFEYRKRFGIHTVTVIAKQNQSLDWVIISCWMDPPLKGTPDAIKKQRYYRYINGNLLTRLWLQLARRFFHQDF